MFKSLNRHALLSLGLFAIAISHSLNAAEWTKCLEDSFNNVAMIKTFDLVFTGPISDGQSRVAFDGENWLIETSQEIQIQVENKKLKLPIKTTVTKVVTFDKNISIPQSILSANLRGEKHCELAVEKSSVNAKIDSSIFSIAQPGKDVYKNAPNQ